MTGPGTEQPTTPWVVIDGKYKVEREISRNGNVTLYEVTAPDGVTRQLAWFEVATPTDRQQFHAYRTALRAIAPAGLSDVVARPGAYYALWQAVAGTPLADFLAQPIKMQETVEAVTDLSARLAENGFALSDADLVLDGSTPRVAYLRPAFNGRTPEDVRVLNGPTLAALNGGKVKKTKKPREPGAWLAFIPGILFLGAAGYLGAQAAQVYLNPPVGEVKSVLGQDARAAAQALTKAGFKVEYTYGDSGNARLGEVIRQEPDGGTSLSLGRSVILTVNKPEPLTAPKLEDLTVAQLDGPLKDNALKLGKVIKVDGTMTNTPEGRVIAQVPAAGSTTQRGQPVQVMVSAGIRGKETWISDLKGMTFEQARDNARAAGLVVTKYVKKPSDLAENIVLDQTPKPFVRVAVGSPVTLVISTAKFTPPTTPAGKVPLPPPYVPPPPPEPTPAPDTTPTTPEQAPETPAPDTTTPQEIPALPQNSTGEGTVQTPDPLTTRQVTFSYVFPADLPAGTYSVVVQDADGEHAVMPDTDATKLAGLQATAPATVRGNAIFIIRVNGTDSIRVEPQ